MKKIYISLIITLTLSSAGYSQTGIGTPSPDASAILHLESSNKGFLPPRVALKAKTDATTIPNPATGLIVYNTATAGTGSDNVVPGLMINTGTATAPIWSIVNAGLEAWGLAGNTNTAASFLGTKDNQPLRIITDDTEKMTIAADGKVGIGITVPIAALDVKNPVKGGDIASFIEPDDSNGVAITWAGMRRNGTNRDGDFKISPKGTGKVDLDGPVSVKTLNTGAAGDQIVTADANGNLRKRTVASIVTTTNALSSSGNTITSNVNGVSSTANAVNTNALSLSGTKIKSTVNGFASNELELSGLAGWGLAGNAAGTGGFLGTTDNQSLRIRTNNTEKMIINSQGRVGIGVTGPTYALDVVSPTNDEFLAGFQKADKKKGVAIGFSGISAIGTDANSSIGISSKGTGKINLDGAVVLKTLAAGVDSDQIITADSNGNLRKRAVGDILGATTNTLTSSGNNITSTVNGKAATASAVNSNTLSLSGTDLTSTVNGIASTALDLSELTGWGLEGNAIAANRFLGTTNNERLRFRVNDSEKVTFTEGGRVGIGNIDPASALDVVSSEDGGILARFLENNKTQGVAINYEGISKFGDDANSDFKISPKGTGKVNLDGPVLVKELTAGAASDEIVTADANGNLRKRAVGDVVGSTTNTLTSSANNITSTVNGKTATALAVNTNALSLSGTKLKSTVNGVASSELELSGLAGWGLSGNNAGTAGVLGTTDNQPLRIVTNKTEKMTITSGGKVGIGNTTPAAVLDVKNTGVGGEIASFLEKDNSNGVAITWAGMQKNGTTTNSDFKITPKGTGKVNLDGPVLVKTLAAGVAGDQIVTADASGNLRKRSVGDVLGATTNTLTSSGNTITSTVNGKAATADAVNTNALALSGTNLTSTVNGKASNALDLSGLTGWGLRGNSIGGNDFFGTTNNQSLRIQTNGTEKVRINAAGRVGIGTDSPGYAIDVVNPSTDGNTLAGFRTNDLKDGVAVVWSGLNKIGSNANSDFKISPKGTGKVNLDGPVLIKTLTAGAAADSIVTADTNNNLRKRAVGDVLGGAWGLAGNDATASSFLGTKSNHYLRFRTNDVERMAIATNGKVGIGNATPAADLDVKSTENGKNIASFVENDNSNGVAITWAGMHKNGSSANSDFKITPKGTGKVNLDGPVLVKTLAAGVAGDQIVTADASGNLRKRAVGDVLGLTTNTLTSSGNTITSTVNGKTATADAVNTNALALNGTNLTSTVNGKTSNALNLSGLAGWGLAGNAATTSSFLGTTSNHYLRFKTNDVERMAIATNGKVGIGNTAPTADLDVKSTENGKDIARFLENNGTQGVAVTYQGMSKIGNDTNSDFKISPKGTGKVNLDGPVLVKTLAAGASSDQIVTADGSGNLRKRAVSDIATAVTADAPAAVQTSGNTKTIKNSEAHWNANKLQGRNVSSWAPSTGQLLQWNGSEWRPYSLPVSTTSPVIQGRLGSGTTIPAYSTDTMQNTGATIVIPAYSSYIINAYMLADVDGSGGAGFYNSSVWLRSGFSSSSSYYSKSPYIQGPGLVSGKVGGNVKFEMITGSAIVRNTSGASITLYYWVQASERRGTDQRPINNFGTSGAGENQLYAVPIIN